MSVCIMQGICVKMQIYIEKKKTYVEQAKEAAGISKGIVGKSQGGFDCSKVLGKLSLKISREICSIPGK